MLKILHFTGNSYFKSLIPYYNGDTHSPQLVTFLLPVSQPTATASLVTPINLTFAGGKQKVVDKTKTNCNNAVFDHCLVPLVSKNSMQGI